MSRFLPSTACIVACLLAAGHAQAPSPAVADAQVQLGDRLLSEGRYTEAADAFVRALGSETLGARAGVGFVLTQLRLGEFERAYTEAAALRERYPHAPDVAASHGDALWAYGLFDDAEAAYAAALDTDPAQARARNGRARALAARSRLPEAAAEARSALQVDARDAEFHYTAGAIAARMHRFDDASLAFRNYVNLLPNRDTNPKAAWARAEIRFLDSFKGRRPFDLGPDHERRAWRVPIRIERDKVLVRGRVNGGAVQDFVLDTGAEQTVISRDVARRRGVVPITYVQSAGVGNVGLRGLQAGRLDTLQIGDLAVRNVPCLIKNPPLAGLPGAEPDSFSPLAIGLSMRVDYARRELVMSRSLESARYDTELPLRMHRLATVLGRVNGIHRATFIVDTGGEAISISQTTADVIQTEAAVRRIPLKVYGTSGWDTEAFLLPNVDLEFSSIRMPRSPVIVLNLKAPSALLGFQLGGIVGHRFLSQYRVSIDLERSVLALERTGSSR